MSRKVIVGLDIGIASVGWCITDFNNLKIIRWGVELHDALDDVFGKLKNEERRIHRSQRRRLSRLKTRKRDFIKYIVEQGFLKAYNFSPNDPCLVQRFREEFLIPYDRKQNTLIKEMPWVYYYRRQLLKFKCTEEDLIAVLYWYISHRGSMWQEEDYVEQENKSSDESHKALKTAFGKNGVEFLEQQKKLLKSNFPIERQIAAAKDWGLNKYRHINNYAISNVDLIRELKQIFKVQDCSQEFKNHILELFKRQRDYSKGPGSEKSPTPYGLYRIDDKGVVKKTHKYLWEYNVGNCSVLPTEKRGPKGALTFECFCLLNDLTNLRINRHKDIIKLTPDDKKSCFKIALKTLTSKSIIKQIKTLISQKYGCDLNDIEGFRINNSKQEIITELKTFHLLKPILFANIAEQEDYFASLSKIFFENSTNFTIKENNFFDAIAMKFVDLRNIKEREEAFKKEWTKYLGDVPYPDNCDEQLKKIFNSSNFKGRSSLCLKIMRLFIPEIINSDKNFEELKNLEKINDKDIAGNYNFEDLNQIKQYIKQYLIISPTSQRSLLCSLNVMVAIEKYCQSNNLILTRVAIEMTRSKNNKQEKDSEKKKIEINTKNKKEFEDWLSENKIEKNSLKGKSNIKLKYLLAKEQGFIDPYNGAKIPFNSTDINEDFQIDHIIPFSWCYDNSRRNKVLTSLNQEKAQKTPYQAWGNNNKKWNQIKKNCDNIYSANLEKKKKILSEIDYSLPENRIGFIGRNLNDTSYAVKNFLQILKKRYKQKNVNVFAINGKSTHYARVTSFKNSKTKKDRDTNHHHAEDAFFLTILCKHYNQTKTQEKFSSYDGADWLLDATSGLTQALETCAQQIHKRRNQIHFWRSSQRHKFNVAFYNQTLYSSVPGSENEIWKIEKINLLELTTEACEKKLIDNPEKILAYNSNRALIKAIQDVYYTYKTAKHPFKTYLEENRETTKSPLMPLKFCVNNKEVICNFLRFKSENNAKSNLNIVKVSNQNNKAFHDTLNWIQIWIYRNKKGKYCLIPITAKNAIFYSKTQGFKIKQDILNQQKSQKKIELSSKPYRKIFKYDLIKIKKDSNELYYVNGCKKSSETLELKKIDLSTSERKFYSLNTALKNAVLIRNNILGQNKSKLKLLEV